MTGDDLDVFVDAQVRRIKTMLAQARIQPATEAWAPTPAANGPGRGSYHRRGQSALGRPNALFHGKLSGYFRYRCHCHLCQAVGDAYNQARRLRRKQAQQGDAGEPEVCG